MNKVVNIFTAITLAIYCFIVMALVYDLTLSSKLNLRLLPYKQEICIGLSLLVFLLGLIRVKRRWQGLLDMKRFKNFHFETPITSANLNRSRMFTLIEVIFMFGLLYFMYNMAQLSLDYTLPMIIVISFLAIESIFFLGKLFNRGKGFKLGINKNVLAYFDREMHIYYFEGLRRIELHQDLINFQYKGDLNLFLPLEVIEAGQLKQFKEALIKTVETYAETKGKKNIYIDDAFRNLT
jgi:hypothetical protein